MHMRPARRPGPLVSGLREAPGESLATAAAQGAPPRAERGTTSAADVFPVRPVLGGSRADPPIASEGVSRTRTRSVRGTLKTGPGVGGAHGHRARLARP